MRGSTILQKQRKKRKSENIRTKIRISCNLNLFSQNSECECQIAQPSTLLYLKSYRCPKFDSYAMQTLEIRVEQKGIFDETDNELSKTRQIEVSFSKTKREKKITERFANYMIRG